MRCYKVVPPPLMVVKIVCVDVVEIILMQYGVLGLGILLRLEEETPYCNWFIYFNSGGLCHYLIHNR